MTAPGVIEHKRGDSLRIRFTITDPDTDDPIDVSDDEVWDIQAQMRLGSPDGLDVIEFVFDPADLANGEIILEPTLEESEGMGKGDWYADLQVTKLSPLWRRSTENWIVRVTPDPTHD